MFWPLYTIPYIQCKWGWFASGSPVFKPQRAMGLGHSTSPVLLTHVNLLCKDANKFTQFFLSKKHMHWGGYISHLATQPLSCVVERAKSETPE